MKGYMVRKNFTLIEILTVLGLMAILLFIALPAFEKLAKGHGVELAARNLTSKLGQARGYAITSREYVALLMPTASTTNAPSPSTTKLLLPEHAFKGYKLCVVSSSCTSGSPNIFTFKRWLPSEKWEFLPNGTAINDIFSSAHANVSTWNNTLLEVVDGVNLKELDPLSSTTYDTVSNVRAIVFKPTGKMAVTLDRYIAVSESTYNGTTLTATNPKNWIDITVDQFTGRVTYGSE
jgi:Tfp pilus assembly protein PilE